MAKSRYHGTLLAYNKMAITSFIRFEDVSILIYGLINGELVFQKLVLNKESEQQQKQIPTKPGSVLNKLKLSFGVIESISFMEKTKLLYIYSQGCIFHLFFDINNKGIFTIIDELDFQSFKRKKLVINFKNSYYIPTRRYCMMFIPSYSKIIKYDYKDNHTTTFDTPFVNKIPMGCVRIKSEDKQKEKLFVLFKREDLGGSILFIEEINTCNILYKINLCNNEEKFKNRKYFSFRLFKDDNYFFIYFVDDQRYFYELKLNIRINTLETKTISDIIRKVKISKDPILFYTVDMKSSFSLFMCRNNKLKFIDMKDFKLKQNFKNIYGKFRNFTGLYKGELDKCLYIFTSDEGIVEFNIDL